MTVERTDKEIIIRLPLHVKTEDLQDMVNYARFLELTADFDVSQMDIDKLAEEINQHWWEKNRQRFIR